MLAILGKEAPPVISRGGKFYNIDRWTVRFLLKHMCEWAKQNPRKNPTRPDIAAWVSAANREVVSERDRRIVIASTPAKLTVRVAMALVGGGYHEAFHTKYTCRRDLIVDEVCAIVLPRWKKVVDWSKVYSLLQDCGNVVEDIRIERIGGGDFPGVHIKMCDLQDFVLQQEWRDRESSQDKPSALTVALSTFRDLGLGYETSQQERSIAAYREFQPQAFSMVESGPLAPLLDEAISLTRFDSLGCLRIALDVVAEIAHLASKAPPQQQPQLVLAVAGPPQEPGNGEGSGSGGPTKAEEDEPGGSEPANPQGSGSGDGPSSKGEPKDKPGQGAGGHEWDPEAAEGWGVIALEIVGALANGEDAGLRDGASALSEAFEQVCEQEDSSCEEGEAPWRPYNPGLDVVEWVQPSKQGKDFDLDKAIRLLAGVKTQATYLRARLRSIILALEQRGVIHGVRHGLEISDRMLVDSVASIRAGHAPTRAYYKLGDKVDTSLSAAVIIDQSSSMGWGPGGSKLKDATCCMMILAEPLDALGCPVLVAGFRDGPRGAPEPGMTYTDYHRVSGVCHDVFKGFTERFAVVKWRFANTRAVGGTPMADGIQFGLDALSPRKEAHRLLFVITDGEPNGGDMPVITRQLRLAQEAGIHVVGIGIGKDCKEVMKLFPDHVWAAQITDIPMLLITKLNEMLDFRGLKRGRMIRQTA